MRPDSPALFAEQCLAPIKQVRSLDLLDGTTESQPEIAHKSRRTLMSPQEREIARCNPNQLEMMTNSLHWLQSNAPFRIIQDSWLGFSWETLEVP